MSSAAREMKGVVVGQNSPQAGVDVPSRTSPLDPAMTSFDFIPEKNGRTPPSIDLDTAHHDMGRVQIRQVGQKKIGWAASWTDNDILKAAFDAMF